MFRFIRKCFLNACCIGDPRESEREEHHEDQFASCATSIQKASNDKASKVIDLQVKLSKKTLEKSVLVQKGTNTIQQLEPLIQVQTPIPKVPTPKFEFKMFKRVIRKRFQIADAAFLAQGGYGAVYACNPLDEENGERCALKVMQSKYMAPKEARKTWQQRVSREVSALSKMDHENIMKYYDFMFLKYPPNPVGACYIAIKTELLDCTLSQVIKARKGLSHSQVGQLLRTLGRALVWMVSQGYAHHDIKPDNIMFKNLDLNAQDFEAKFEEAIPKFTDFGFARRYKGPRDEATEDYFCAGSPIYMSPEKYAFFRKLTTESYYPFKSDDFAFGVTLLQCLCQQMELAPIFANLKVNKILLVRLLKTYSEYVDASEYLDAIGKLLKVKVEDRSSVGDVLDSLN